MITVISRYISRNKFTGGPHICNACSCYFSINCAVIIASYGFCVNSCHKLVEIEMTLPQAYFA